jgi:hypothetical protein
MCYTKRRADLSDVAGVRFLISSNNQMAKSEPWHSGRATARRGLWPNNVVRPSYIEDFAIIVGFSGASPYHHVAL